VLGEPHVVESVVLGRRDLIERSGVKAGPRTGATAADSENRTKDQSELFD
jgi:hypothetical protein